MEEPNEELFRMFHRYNKLVRRSLVKPLICKSCDAPLVTGIGEGAELVLSCFSCGSKTKPGVATISRVNAVVKEHFIDE